MEVEYEPRVRGATAQYLHLTPVRGQDAGRWTVQLEEDLLSLVSADERIVLMLPREEAARHIRFRVEVLHGRVVSFVVHEGLRGYRFKCSSADMHSLLEWLPQRPRAERDQETRYYGALLVLAGSVQLFFDEVFAPGAGVALTALGLISLLFPRRPAYALNGAGLMVLGLVLLFMPLAGVAYDETLMQLANRAVGAVLLIWSVQQFAMLSPDQQLRRARQQRDAKAPAAGPVKSGVVGWVAVASALTSVALFFGLALVVVEDQRQGAGFGTRDQLLYAVPALVTLVSAVVLRLRVRTPYAEARLIGQFLLAVVLFYGCAIAHNVYLGRGLLDGALRWQGAFLAQANLVLIPLIVLVLAFNFAYTLATERELEAHRH